MFKVVNKLSSNRYLEELFKYRNLNWKKIAACQV